MSITSTFEVGYPFLLLKDGSKGDKSNLKKFTQTLNLGLNISIKLCVKGCDRRATKNSNSKMNRCCHGNSCHKMLPKVSCRGYLMEIILPGV